MLALQSAQLRRARRHDVVGWGDVGGVGTIAEVSSESSGGKGEGNCIPSVGKLGLKHLTVVVHVLDVFLALGLHLGLQLSVGGVLVGDGGHCVCSG